MKTKATIVQTIIAIGLLLNNTYSQGILPDANLKKMDGSIISSSSLTNDSQPFIICFWKSCCNSSLKFMDALNDIYPDIVEDYNIKIFAISIDDSRTSDKVRPLADGNSWEFDIYLDTNEDFARKMNINLTPHCLLYDGQSNLIWQKQVCMEGDEYIIEQELHKLD